MSGSDLAALDTFTGYPRPQLRRAGWHSLDGGWDFALDPEALWRSPDQVEWKATIEVPFSPETPASGIGEDGLFRACWYRRQANIPAPAPAKRVLLHFGAVDYRATVWFNGCRVMRHEGGYTPFYCDVTDHIDPSGTQVIDVCAEDDPLDLAKPRGKQDWQRHPHSIWYPRTSGIWQMVWWETVPASWIARLRWTPNLERWELGLEVFTDGDRRDDLRLRVRLSAANRLLALDTYQIISGEVHRRIALSDPGIDDSRNELLWSPSRPTLIQAHLQLWGERGELVDEVESYTALRSVGVQGDRLLVNGRPFPLRMVLDQGYWPQTGQTPPDDEALRRDIELTRAMGFNGVRKHQKIEDPRYLYWADVIGLLVWEEMPSAYRYTKRCIDRLTHEWLAAMERDISHPCIVAWVPFNESWGVPDLPDSPAQRHYVQALYHLTKSFDPTRPVIGNDGWESVATDIIGIHDYDHEPERIAHRYGVDDDLSRLLRRERPGGRLLTIGDPPADEHPIVLTEFGGIAFSPDTAGTWGYSRALTADALAERYARLMKVIHSLPLAGFCYTQLTDTYQETNGLLYADRRPKFSLEAISEATRGPRGHHEHETERAWRERLMEVQRHQYRSPLQDHRTHDE